jgi:hypothetical protein
MAMNGGKSPIFRHALGWGHGLFRTQILFYTLQFGPRSTPREPLTTNLVLSCDGHGLCLRNVIHWIKSLSWRKKQDVDLLQYCSYPCPWHLFFYDKLICYTGTCCLVAPCRCCLSSASEQRINVDACCTGIS